MITESHPPKYRKPSVPEVFWVRYLRPILIVRPNGITIKELKDLFVKEHEYQMSPKVYGFNTIEELLSNIEVLCVCCGKVFFDWGHWPEILP